MKTNVCYQGDCLEVMKGIEDKSIDMILCDLPYGTTACKWDTIIPFEPLWEQYKRIIKDNGAIVLTASQPFTSALVMSNIKDFRYNLIWNKRKSSSALHAKIQPLRIHEDIVIFSKNKTVYNPQMVQGKPRIDKENKISNGEAFGNNTVTRKYENKEGLYYPKSILDISNADQTNKLHPTQKPVALFEYLIKTYTNEGDLILDNTAGSGTTGVACKNTNRNFILIEQDEKYCDIIKERVGCEIIKPSFYSTTGIDQAIKEQEEDNVKLNKELDIKNEINILNKCPKCNGKLVKTKYGMTCEDCLEDF